MTQVKSNSVADSLEWCQLNMDELEFKDNSGTCMFLRRFNLLINRMNSNKKFGKFSKKAIMSTNINEVKNDFVKAEHFITSLCMMPGTQLEPPMKKPKNQLDS